MSESDVLRSEIKEILEEVAKTLKITKFEITFDDKALEANGFLSDFFLGEVKNLQTQDTHKVAIKKAFKNEFRRKRTHIPEVFQNENRFYSVIFPKLDEFQREKNVKEPFNSIPKYFCGSVEPLKEFIALENVKVLGYDIRERDSLIDDELAKYIFALYGKFHALSFALRDQKPEVFEELAEPMFDYWKEELNENTLHGFMDSVIKEAFGMVDKKQTKLLEDCKEFYEGTHLFDKEIFYRGNNLVLTHGDCWSNNMMFKTESGKLHSMKLIDFQLAKAATPVFDLSYFFYVGGSKELFDKLDDYLKIYHDSLSNFIEDLGSDPKKLYSFEQLKQDWKDYARFGAMLSFALAKIKLMNREALDNARENMEKEELETGGFSKVKVNEELLKKRLTDVIIHGYQYGIFK